MIDFKMNAQPDDESCGPTCLHALYEHYGLDISFNKVKEDVERSHSGGTLAPMLGKHALQKGFKTTLYVNHLQLYDPSWFINGRVESNYLKEKLMQQMHYKRNRFLAKGSHSVLDYLTLGGEVRFDMLTIDLLRHYLDNKIPILTGLSSTYLYNSRRELFNKEGKSTYDDVRGFPCGHFVVLCGYKPKENLVVVADPYKANPLSGDHYYSVNANRLINAIMLGVVTLDGNLLIIEQK